MKFPPQLRALFRRDKFDAGMVEQRQLHADLPSELNGKADMNPGEAHSGALRQFGERALRAE